ncbi:UPF0261 protein BPP1817-like [Cucumis melo var. makuwa]|uniref:UPF0261 protein BPP1817-like n=1 Tax=Cucumis melo var. makuwa TaxID=1194695 RepID=A0A5A7T149_CUCMM|nr:UPF0261 protein BPP1817-like [Cucumis melo var. makuwa]
MFGVTTPCVNAVKEILLTEGYKILVFHATGVGGKAMESLVKEGFIQGVLDITTTEVADYLIGGVMACDSTRFDAIIEKRIPLVLSVGAVDMVSLMRTTVEEWYSQNFRAIIIDFDRMLVLQEIKERRGKNHGRISKNNTNNGLNENLEDFPILIPTCARYVGFKVKETSKLGPRPEKPIEIYEFERYIACSVL